MIKANIKNLILVLVIIALILSLTSCSQNLSATNLMKDLVPSDSTNGLPTDDAFKDNTANFYLELFKKSYDEKNTLISPLSVLTALAMTANGADGETLAQMQKVIGNGMEIEKLNKHLYYYLNNLPSKEDSKLTIANSAWIRDGFDVKKEFLQTNRDYYNIETYQGKFDDSTIKDINNWVDKNTDGLIEKIVDKIPNQTIMYLINAVLFDAKWKKVYTEDELIKGEFTSIDGSKNEVEFMTSVESIYLEDNNCLGVVKPYVSGYSFAAILPKEELGFNEFVEGLTGEKLLNLINNKEEKNIRSYLPKFSFEFELTMNDILKSMGIVDAFSDNDADFSKIAILPGGNIFISEVVHKTYISVDELGTKAGAATKVEINESSAMESLIVKFDRPFVFAIIDDSTSLPIFVGAVTDLQN